VGAGERDGVDELSGRREREEITVASAANAMHR
jgi:hypothetical protein